MKLAVLVKGSRYMKSVNFFKSPNSVKNRSQFSFTSNLAKQLQVDYIPKR